MNNITRESAVALLNEYTKSASLLRHAYSVEAAMGWYARHYKLPESDLLLWQITGLLHDFDYEMYPNPTPPDGHPFKGVSILKELGYPEAVCEAILGHAAYSGVPRTTAMAKTLFAVDELSGLTVATSLVRPDKLLKSVEVKSVLKRFKEPSFARGCNRDDITLGCQEIGLTLEEHVGNVLLALQELEAAGLTQQTS